MKNVSFKLLQAIKKVGGKVTKTGYNSFSKYKYITESDINEAILPALVEQGLLLTTSVESVEETAASAEVKNRFATVKLLHKIIDTETGETLEFYSVGTAADTLDKAIYKAYTGSCKYFMLKLFLISGDDSDPENDVKAKPVTPVVKPVAQPQGFFAKKSKPDDAPVKATVPVKKTDGVKPTFGAKPVMKTEVQEVEQTEEVTENQDPGF